MSQVEGASGLSIAEESAMGTKDGKILVNYEITSRKVW